MIHINLLGEKKDNSRLMWLQLICFGAMMTIGLLACVGYHTSIASENGSLEAEKQSLDTRLAQLRERTKKVEDLDQKRKLLQEKLTTIARLKAKKQGPVQTLNDITETIPKPAWLTTISQKDNTMEFEGLAVDPQVISMFMSSLEKSPSFEKVELNGTQQQTRDGVPLHRFKLTLTLRNPLEVKKLRQRLAEERLQATPPTNGAPGEPQTAPPMPAA